MKVCTKCGELKELELFANDKRNKERGGDGKQPKCKECNKKYYGDNVEKVKKRVNDSYHSNHQEELAKRKIQRSKPENKIKKRLQDKNWIENNRDAYNKMSRAHCSNRRARLKQVEGKLTSNDIEFLFETQNQCSYCFRDDIKLTVDHVIPINKGGSNNLSNVVLACFSCNSSKGDKNLIDWIAENSLIKYINKQQKDLSGLRKGD